MAETTVNHLPGGAPGLSALDQIELAELRRRDRERVEARLAACEAGFEDMRASMTARLDQAATMASEALALAQSLSKGSGEGEGTVVSGSGGDSNGDGAAGAGGARGARGGSSEGGKPALRIDMATVKAPEPKRDLIEEFVPMLAHPGTGT